MSSKGREYCPVWSCQSSRRFMIRLEAKIISFLSVKPKPSGNLSRFPIETWFPPRLFLLKFRTFFLRPCRDFLPWLMRGKLSWDRLISGANFHLPTSQQIWPTIFFNNPVIRSPLLVKVTCLLRSLLKFLYVETSDGANHPWATISTATNTVSLRQTLCF